MHTVLARLIVILTLLSPFAAQANDATDFVVGDSCAQAKLLDSWAAQPVPERLALLLPLQAGDVAADAGEN